MKTKNEYQYILKWNKRIRAIEILGGKCNCCGEINPLLLCFHHIDSVEKEFEINRIKNARWILFEKEIKNVFYCV